MLGPEYMVVLCDIRTTGPSVKVRLLGGPSLYMKLILELPLIF